MKKSDNFMTHNLSHALTVFSENLNEIRKACVENCIAYNEAAKPYEKLDIDKPITIEAIEKHLRFLEVTQQVEYPMRVIKRIDGLRRYSPRGRITDEHIQIARDTDLQELYDGTLYGRKGSTMKGLCPFHEENTPSFTIFKNNRFKCFGCDVYGDSIEFVMKRDECSFVDAVKFLT